ncbi:uncharacterized protein [Rutidosis leptorrhynchoides]|uniref:uncharacterized protein isoform X4 n=1 Tax=Rutidosis leptorrhynchoides TaxID=125765 RepID=UPI003A99392F
MSNDPLYALTSHLKGGPSDELGAEAMIMDALEKLEKETKKPLLRNNKKEMALLTDKFNKINQKRRTCNKRKLILEENLNNVILHRIAVFHSNLMTSGAGQMKLTGTHATH